MHLNNLNVGNLANNDWDPMKKIRSDGIGGSMYLENVT